MVGNSLAVGPLLDDLVGSKPLRTEKKRRPKMILEKYGPQIVELSKILNLPVTALGNNAVIVLSNDTSLLNEEVDKLLYNFEFIVTGLRSVLLVLTDYDANFQLKFSTEQIFSFFRSFWTLVQRGLSPLKVMKYFTVWFFAKYLNNDLPSNPGLDNEYLFTGKIRSYLKQRLVSHSKKNQQLWATFLQGIKRGCKEAAPWFVEEALRKHKEVLSKERPVANVTFMEEFQKKSSKVMKYFSGSPKFHQRDLEHLQISGSACWEQKRSDGGAHDEVLKSWNYIRTRNDYNFSISSLLFGVYSPRKGVQYYHGLASPSLSDMITLIYANSMDLSPYFGDPLSGFFTEDVDYGIRDWDDEDFLDLGLEADALHKNCMVSAILEPLKMRLITKGNAYTYYYARSMQKSMHSYLKDSFPFCLIGTPLTEDHLYQLEDRTQHIFPEANLYVSGDYSSATDMLKLAYTKAAFEPWLDALQAGEHNEILRAVLYEHTVHYSNQFVKINNELRKLNPDLTDLEPFVQQNGQLMGSVLSFPILCVCNLIAYWISLERHLGKTITDWRTLPVLINGDDILFKTTPEHYQTWLKCIEEVGFELSVGKNYVHKNILTVNSKLFRRSENNVKITTESGSLVKKHVTFTEFNFFNVGLLLGNSKVMDSRQSTRSRDISKNKTDFERDDAPFASDYNSVIYGAMNPKWAHKMFLHYHRDDVKTYTDNGRLSLHLPYHLGGLGCKVPTGVEDKTGRELYITPGQLRVAQALTEQMLRVGHGISKVDKTYGFTTGLPRSDTLTVHERPVSGIHLGFGPLKEIHSKHEDIDLTVTNSELVQVSPLRFHALERRKFYSLCKSARSEIEVEMREPLFVRTIRETPKGFFREELPIDKFSNMSLDFLREYDLVSPITNNTALYTVLPIP